MEGLGSRGVLGVESPDPVLSLVAALGLGSAAGTALVVDMATEAQLVTGRTLADLVEDGPSLQELSPARSGVALIAAGPALPKDSVSQIQRLAHNWPAVVVRAQRGDWPGPTVPVRPLWPGLLTPIDPFPAVWQALGSGVRPPGPGPVLPRLGSAAVRRMLAGQVPRTGRWLRVWEQVWRMPWA